MQIIKEITASETFLVRHPVLRAGKPIESCAFDGDKLETTKHFGLFENGKLGGIITILEKKMPMFDLQKQFQFRGMAVVSEHQKKGFGEALLRYSENYVMQQKGSLIWFNARVAAVGFYEKCGYEIIGNLFEIPDVGPHFTMFKTIS